MSFASTIVWSTGTYVYYGDTIVLNDKLGFRQLLIKNEDNTLSSYKTLKGLSYKTWYPQKNESKYVLHNCQWIDKILADTMKGFAYLETAQHFRYWALKNPDSAAYKAKRPKGMYNNLDIIIDGHSGIGRVTVRKNKTTCYIGDEVVFTGNTEFKNGRLYINDTNVNFRFSFLVDSNGSLYTEKYRGFPVDIFSKRRNRYNYR